MSNCPQHPGLRAAWQCLQCEEALCLACTVGELGHGPEVIRCAHCEGPVAKIKSVEAEVRAAAGLPPRESVAPVGAPNPGPLAQATIFQPQRFDEEAAPAPAATTAPDALPPTIDPNRTYIIGADQEFSEPELDLESPVDLALEVERLSDGATEDCSNEAPAYLIASEPELVVRLQAARKEAVHRIPMPGPPALRAASLAAIGLPSPETEPSDQTLERGAETLERRAEPLEEVSKTLEEVAVTPFAVADAPERRWQPRRRPASAKELSVAMERKDHPEVLRIYDDLQMMGREDETSPVQDLLVSRLLYRWERYFDAACACKRSRDKDKQGEWAGRALYLQARIMGERLQMRDESMSLLQKCIDRYPTDTFAGKSAGLLKRYVAEARAGAIAAA
ncbi:MAG: hypothetical protein ACI9WU_001781 [Myxococcota bacterium]|jgi:hypothetical protein